MYEQQKVLKANVCVSPMPGVYFIIPANRQVLEDMEMLSAFTSILHVPNLSKPEHFMTVMEESLVFSDHELKSLAKQVQGKRYAKMA